MRLSNSISLNGEPQATLFFVPLPRLAQYRRLWLGVKRFRYQLARIPCNSVIFSNLDFDSLRNSSSVLAANVDHSVAWRSGQLRVHSPIAGPVYDFVPDRLREHGVGLERRDHICTQRMLNEQRLHEIIGEQRFRAMDVIELSAERVRQWSRVPD